MANLTAGHDHDHRRLVRYWDRHAGSYDQQMRFLDRRLFGRARAWIGAQATGEVLEVAIGTGLNLPLYPADARLTGIEWSPAMLAIARDRAAQLGREVELRQADAQALPFQDETFDTVVCTLGLCGFPDERAAIAEMHRVLRPQGTLLLLDHVGSHHRLIRAGQWLLEKLTVRMLGDHQTRRPLPLVEQTGFLNQRQERLKAGMVERVAAVKPATE
jgi:ubiquinone/menaquinone biosynthesis C-methylase UbiE